MLSWTPSLIGFPLSTEAYKKTENPNLPYKHTVKNYHKILFNWRTNVRIQSPVESANEINETQPKKYATGRVLLELQHTRWTPGEWNTEGNGKIASSRLSCVPEWTSGFHKLRIKRFYQSAPHSTETLSKESWQFGVRMLSNDGADRRFPSAPSCNEGI